ncbi:MAG: hypothetical protein KKI08_09740 [Armatimonadetes bacterium]|nr:hypothetical protein [Armatimonadota bacterium]
MAAVAVALAFLLLPSSFCLGQELLVNGGFEALDAEGGPENWGLRDWGDSQFAAAKVVGKAAHGERCLELKSRSGPLLFGCFSYPIPLGDQPPAQLLLTLSYKADAPTRPEVSVATFAEDFAAQEWDTPVLTSESVALEASPKNWRTVSWRVRLLPSARQAMVMARIHGAGSLLLDGVSLKAYPTEVECTLETPGIAVNTRGGREARLRLTNRTEHELPVRVTVTIPAPKGRRKTTQTTARLAPGKPERVTVGYGYPLDKATLVAITVGNDKRDVVYDFLEDDVPGLLDGWVTSPAFRATILPGMPLSEIAASGVVNAVPEVRRQLKLSGKLSGLGLDLGAVPVDDEGRWQVSTPAEAMLTGNYAVHLTATCDGKPVAEFDLPVLKPEPGAGMAAYDERLRLYVQGQPRLPLGVMMAIDESDLRAVAEAGFNTVVLSSRVASTIMMETAQKLGLAVIVSSASTDGDFWKNQFSRHADLPCVAGWYVLQRPETESPPASPALMGALYSGLAHLDPRHPVCLAVGSLSRLENYSSLCDILMPWTEPMPVGDLRSVDALVRRAVELCDGHRPVWPLIQMTGAGYATDSRLEVAGNGRPPTGEEYRCMAYLALARGGNGVFANAFRVVAGRGQRDYLVTREAPELWEAVRKVNSELRALTPVLLEGEPLAVQTSNPAVALRGLRYNDACYVLAANPLSAPAALTLKVPGMKTNVLEVAFDTRRVQGLTPGEFADQLEPHGVRVYMGR